MEILDIADHVLGIRLSGKIEKSDMDGIVAEVEAKLTRHERLAVYVELESFDGISLEGFLTDLKLGKDHFSDFSKKAVVSDAKWLAPLVPIFDKLFPSIELRQFPPEQAVEARAWVKQ